MRRAIQSSGVVLVIAVFGLGCPFDDDGSGEDPSIGVMPYEASDCAIGNEPSTRTFTIRDLRIPARPSADAPLSTVGFDIDGLTSTDMDLAGCNQADMPGGVDNALASIVVGLDSLSLDGSAFGVVPFMNFIALEIVVSDWNGTSTDPCVVVTLEGSMRGESIAPVVGRGALSSGFMSTVVFGADLPVALRIEPDPEGDCTVDCLGEDIDFTVEDLVARLRFSDDMMDLVVAETPDNTNTTMFGGHIRYTGSDPGAFGNVVTTFVDRLDPALTPTVGDYFRRRLDLDGSPTLTACTSVGNGTSADAFSIAILASSVAP